MAIWRKSSHSGAQENACIELADLGQGAIGIRDGKNTRLSHLTVTPAALRDVAERIKHDAL